MSQPAINVIYPSPLDFVPAVFFAFSARCAIFQEYTGNLRLGTRAVPAVMDKKGCCPSLSQCKPDKSHRRLSLAAPTVANSELQYSVGD
jgi:hypothetical protein